MCQAGVRRFNELAAGLDNTEVIGVSQDLPFAVTSFCAAEGLEDVIVGSAFRSGFGTDYGITMADGKWRGLLARASSSSTPTAPCCTPRSPPPSASSPTTTPPSPPSADRVELVAVD